MMHDVTIYSKEIVSVDTHTYASDMSSSQGESEDENPSLSSSTTTNHALNNSITTNNYSPERSSSINYNKSSTSSQIQRISRRYGNHKNDWTIVEGFYGDNLDLTDRSMSSPPPTHEGYITKRRRWPMKGWHKRYFKVEKGILLYAKNPAMLSRGRFHGKIDTGLTVITYQRKQGRIDIDADNCVHHLKMKDQRLFESWLDILTKHRRYRQWCLASNSIQDQQQQQQQQPTPLSNAIIKSQTGHQTENFTTTGKLPKIPSSTLTAVSESAQMEQMATSFTETQKKIDSLRDILQHIQVQAPLSSSFSQPTVSASSPAHSVSPSSLPSPFPPHPPPPVSAASAAQHPHSLPLSSSSTSSNNTTTTPTAAAAIARTTTTTSSASLTGGKLLNVKTAIDLRQSYQGGTVGGGGGGGGGESLLSSPSPPIGQNNKILCQSSSNPNLHNLNRSSVLSSTTTNNATTNAVNVNNNNNNDRPSQPQYRLFQQQLQSIPVILSPYAQFISLADDVMHDIQQHIHRLYTSDNNNANVNNNSINNNNNDNNNSTSNGNSNSTSSTNVPINSLSVRATLRNRKIVNEEVKVKLITMRDELDGILSVLSTTNDFMSPSPSTQFMNVNNTTSTLKNKMTIGKSRSFDTESTSEMYFDAEDRLSVASLSEASSSEASDEESVENESDTEDIISGNNILSVVEANTGRRDHLPVPMPDNSDFSLFHLLRKNIGRDLSKVRLPVTLHEPLSALQRICEELEYSELLDTAGTLKKPIDRMVYVAAFAVSGYASSFFRSGTKPFNPVLGETYENIREDKGWKFIAEQVSHHPPVSACHCTHDQWQWWQELRLKNKFWGKSLEALPVGLVYLRLNSLNETYRWNKVTTCVHNLFGGKRSIEHYGDMTIECSSGVTCHLTFHRATTSWMGSVNSGQRYQVSGYVRLGDEKRQLFGRWNEGIYCGRDSTARCVWRPGAMPADHDIYYGFTRFAIELNHLDGQLSKLIPNTDSRFRPDQRLLELGELDRAENEKYRVEEIQRTRISQLPNGKEENWTPIWFKPISKNRSNNKENNSIINNNANVNNNTSTSLTTTTTTTTTSTSSAAGAMDSNCSLEFTGEYWQVREEKAFGKKSLPILW